MISCPIRVRIRVRVKVRVRARVRVRVRVRVKVRVRVRFRNVCERSKIGGQRHVVQCRTNDMHPSSTHPFPT